MRRSDPAGTTIRGPLDGVPLLADVPIDAGARWIYTAGFNVAPGSRSMGRVDIERADLARLADHGARVAVLSHQGDGPHNARHLGHVARHLSRTLGRRVGYLPISVGDMARRAARAMRPGDVVIFGNTRFHPGEQANDSMLAGEFAQLGDLVAVGGFAKAHRVHASNVGILAYRPGFVARSIADEIRLLEPWARTDEARYSVAALGGTKLEKSEVGLAHLVDRYDLVIVGGAVLNAVLVALGHPVGGSELGSHPERCVAAARKVLARPTRAELYVPAQVVVAPRNGTGPARVCRVGEPISDAEWIVDLILEPGVLHRLARLGGSGGRGLLAGTPALYRQGHRRTTDLLLTAFSSPGARSLLLGGDTVAELPWSGPASTGGGSALTVLATGGCRLLDVLRR
ncbi:phosphoglycerate kinase [Plantactinospora sp. B6F1]|uniref:phosphoglycerate kinase n=1 Tax=Plantactinospora sp. B6F1 TaxID=3158971 RepID=UPI00102D0472